jgi:4-amino-4-deoxy-L-arabinose transferase-like glycosyltransferase
MLNGLSGTFEKAGMKSWVPGAVLTALVLCSVVPFSARAVYLDEHLYLHIAESAIVNDWRFPQDTQWIFFGTRLDNLAVHTHPPVGEYFLALMLKLFGPFEETRFRLIWGIFSLIAVLGFHRVARHFTRDPLAVAALFAVSPAFFVISPTLMMDMPMLAFFLLGLAFYLDHLSGKQKRLSPAVICFTLSAGTGYTILVPIGCLWLWAISQKRPRMELGALAIAPAALLAWLVAMKVHFGVLPALGVAQYLAQHLSLLGNLLPIFSFLGGVSLFPWLLLVLVDMPHRRWLVVISLTIAALLSLFHNWPGWPDRIWFVVLASSGIGLLMAFIFKSRARTSDEHPAARGFLLLWAPAALLFFFLSAEMICARYILLCLPPIFLIAFGHLRRAVAIPAITVTLILSVAIAAGDYRFVNSYRDWVAQTVVPLQRQGFRIWSATESGLRFYLERNGIATLDNADIRPRGGDLIVRQASFAYGLSDQLGSLLLTIRKTDLGDRYPMRTFVAAAGAGFHDSRFGPVPFSFSSAPLDCLELVEVSPFVIGLPQVVPEDYSSVPVWYPGGVLLKQVQPEMQFPIQMPRDVDVEYVLEGDGTVELSEKGITLKKRGAEAAVWKNFRIIPRAWKASVD